MTGIRSSSATSIVAKDMIPPVIIQVGRRHCPDGSLNEVDGLHATVLNNSWTDKLGAFEMAW